VSIARSTYVAQVMKLFLDHPDTPEMPSSADWEVAGALFERRVPLPKLRLAFQLAYLRRHLRDPAQDPLPPVRSLAYFIRVVDNLSDEETHPVYAEYVASTYQRLRHESRCESADPQSAPSGL
jgi:hypothetical protein